MTTEQEIRAKALELAISMFELGGRWGGDMVGPQELPTRAARIAEIVDAVVHIAVRLEVIITKAPDPMESTIPAPC